MFPEVFFFKSLAFFLYRLLLGKLIANNNNARGRLYRSGSSNTNNTAQALSSSKYHRFSSLFAAADHRHRRTDRDDDLSHRTIVFDVEDTLFRSSSVFAYFMLVAFEAGSFLRALVLLLTYPLLGFLSEEAGLQVMVMVCFFGLKKEGFSVGRSVLPKYMLEEVGWEAYEVLRRGGRRVGVSGLPQVMVESFLRDYLGVEVVVAKELKVVCGYFVGIMEKKKKIRGSDDGDGLEEMVEKEEEQATAKNGGLIGISRYRKCLSHLHQPHHPLFSKCKEIYTVSQSEKRKWNSLPRHAYLKPLIFHDGRLALKPTPLSAVFLFMWAPFGVALALVRVSLGVLLPYNFSIPILSFSGLRLTVSHPDNKPPVSDHHQHHPLYVCNHRTLLDPLYLSFALKRNFTAVTYSLSRVSEIISPIKTVRLTRTRETDAATMRALLGRGDHLVVCPEGTTCREPYLLRFSPLFSEMSEEVVPVALEVQVSMFHGTTAGGLKCLDPLFFMMNPNPSYRLRLLERVVVSGSGSGNQTRFDAANRVQREIGEALGFECTGLTRKDKYLILAGNEGIVSK